MEDNYILIDEWHDSDSDLELHEYLGMSLEEYCGWLESETKKDIELGKMVRAYHLSNGDIFAVETDSMELITLEYEDDLLYEVDEKSDETHRWFERTGVIHTIDEINVLCEY